MAEVLGHHDGVCSVSCSTTNSSVFISAGEDSRIQLWDLRLKKKNFMSLGGSSSSSIPLPNLAEVLLDHNGNSFRIAAACGSQMNAIDVRKPFGLSGSLTLPTNEDVSFLFDSYKCPGNSAGAQWEIIVADDNGSLHRIDASRWVLQEVDSGFGNLCSGMGVTTNGCLWSVSMGGELHGYVVETPPLTKISERLHASNISEIRLQPSQTTQQLHNPPIPTCMTTHGSCIVIGRGDGTYSYYETSLQTQPSIEEMFCAPAHQGNGLLALRWFDQHMFSVALSGEVTGWDITTFINNEFDTDLPEVVFASSLRQGTHDKQIVNCCDTTADNSFILGDTANIITRIPLT